MSGRIGELLLILVIIFVFFGAGKLPKVAGELGKSLRALRNGAKDDESDNADTTKKQQPEE